MRNKIDWELVFLVIFFSAEIRDKNLSRLKDVPYLALKLYYTLPNVQCPYCLTSFVNIST